MSKRVGCMGYIWEYHVKPTDAFVTLQASTCSRIEIIDYTHTHTHPRGLWQLLGFPTYIFSHSTMLMACLYDVRQ